MNNKGFTLIELLATIVVLSIVSGIVVISINGYFGDAKENSEDVFVGTIKDAMDMYLASSSPKSMPFVRCTKKLSKTHGDVNVYYVVTNFESVINSEFHPITQDDLVNPADKNTPCNDADKIKVQIYRDDDYVYYYAIEVENDDPEYGFHCLKQTDVITNLPIIGDTDGDGIEEYYSCS